MLTLPLHLEQCWKSSTSQLEEIAGCWRGGGRHVRTRRASREALVTKIWNQRWNSPDEGPTFDAREKTCVPSLHSSRLKRSYSSKRCRICLNQQIRGSARDSSASGCVLASVSYATTPALEEVNDIALSNAGIQNEERFLNALVTCTPLRIANDKKSDMLRNVDLEEVVGSIPSNRREGPREQRKEVNGSKQKWRLSVEGLQVSPDIQPQSVDLTPNSDHVRQLEEKMFLLETWDIDSAKVLTLCPSIVNITVKKLKSVMDHLEGIGLRRKDLGRILSMTPQILELSVKHHLRPVVRFLLKEVGLRRVDLRKVIIRCPRLLVSSVDSQLRPTMHYLEGLGFTSMASLVSNNATLLTCGIQSKLLPKLEFLQTLGMSLDEAVTMAIRFPAIFNYGVEQNLKPKFDYLVNVMRRDVGHLKAFPQYFGYSLEQRIQPRYEFLLQRHYQMALRNMLKPSDDDFYARFGERQADETGKERKPAAATESLVDQGWKRPELEAVTEAVNRGSIPGHICL